MQIRPPVYVYTNDIAFFFVVFQLKMIWYDYCFCDVHTIRLPYLYSNKCKTSKHIFCPSKRKRNIGRTVQGFSFDMVCMRHTSSMYWIHAFKCQACFQGSSSSYTNTGSCPLISKLRQGCAKGRAPSTVQDCGPLLVLQRSWVALTMWFTEGLQWFKNTHLLEVDRVRFE